MGRGLGDSGCCTKKVQDHGNSSPKIGMNDLYIYKLKKKVISLDTSLKASHWDVSG